MNDTTPVKQMQPKEAALNFIGIVAKAYQLKGLYFREDYPLENVARDTYDLIVEDHPSVTFEIIKDAFRNGIKGKYGDVVGLPPTTLAGFVDSWFKERRGVNMPQLEEKPVLQLARDTRADTINLLQCLYTMHKNKQLIFAMPADTLIQFLWGENMLLDIKESEEKQKEYIAKARAKIGGARRSKLARSVDEDKDGNIIKDVFIQKAEPTTETELLNAAYKLIIFDFFDDCQKMDIQDLHDLFNN